MTESGPPLALSNSAKNEHGNVTPPLTTQTGRIRLTSINNA